MQSCGMYGIPSSLNQEYLLLLFQTIGAVNRTIESAASRDQQMEANTFEYYTSQPALAAPFILCCYMGESMCQKGGWEVHYNKVGLQRK